jgi:probable phosphoglycerate mutase
VLDIFLVRHGEAAAAWSQSEDPGLSELGRDQAGQAAQTLLSGLPTGTRLVSSPLLRARETALPLAAALSLSVEIDPAFREIPSPVPLPERQAWLRKFMQQTWDTQPDTLLQWREQAVQRVLAQREPAVIFTHFLVINAIVGSAQQRPETLCFWPDNASVTHLRHSQGELELVSLGRELSTVVN